MIGEDHAHATEDCPATQGFAEHLRHAYHIQRGRHEVCHRWSERTVF